MQNPPSPFSCTHTPQIPELLNQLQVSLALSTYQAGKMIFLSAPDQDSLVQLPRNFNQPMGIALSHTGNKMALACRDEVIEFRNHPSLAQHYPKSPNKYDAMYMPRVTYHTGPMDIHDLHWGAEDEIYGVNTLFSCLFKLSREHNYQPIWLPKFVTEMKSEDRCHLNGMAMKDGKPAFVTAFNQGNSYRSWKEELLDGGVLMDVDSKEIITKELGMPHTPRIIGGEVFLLESAKGALTKIHLDSGKKEIVFQTDAFLRGMDLIGDYLFISKSKLRKNSSSFGKLPFAEKATEAGVLVVHLPSASLQGEIKYLTSVDEIYDLKIFPNQLRPNILSTLTEDFKAGLALPDSSFWAIKKPNQNE